MILDKIKNFFLKLILEESALKKLTLSFCFGNFIAWSATIPLQTPLIFLFSWLFRLNTKVTFATVYLISNPLTIVPIYAIDYAFGNWFLNTFLKIDTIKYNPAFAQTFSNFLNRYIDLSRILSGSSFCFWCLIIGGVVLPIILSIILYPIMKVVFNKLIKLYKNNVKNRENLRLDHEDNISK